MKYNDLKKSSNVNMANVIYKAMSIFNELQAMEIYRPTKEEAYINVKIDKRDTSVLSLFLAALSSDSKVAKVLKKHKIEYSRMIKTLKIDSIKTDKLSDLEYRKIYTKHFRELMDKLVYLGVNMADCDDFDSYSLDLLYHHFVDSIACNSEIVNELIAASGIEEKDYVQASLDINKISEDDDEEEENVDEVAHASTVPVKVKSPLSDFGSYLTDEEFTVDPAIGREKELNALMTAIATPYMSALLLGEPGVGKTAIAEGFAYRIKNGTVPPYFKDYKIFSANITNVVSGTTYRGEFEAKVNKLINAIKSDPKTILYIDEFHSVVGAGETEKGSNDLANMLKPYLSRGTIKLIGATTVKEYDEHVSSDPALKRRLERVDVKEQDDKTISEILIGTIPLYEKINQVTFGLSDIGRRAVVDIIVEATNKRNREYLDVMFNPGLALSILGKSFAIATIRGSQTVEKSDIVLAINMCHRLYPNVRERKSRELDNMALTEEIKAPCKVIKFSDIKR